MSEEEHKIIHYTVSHEVGVAVGFAALMAICAASFFTVWVLYNKREEKKEQDRKADLIARGFGEIEKGERGYDNNNTMQGGNGNGKEVDRSEEVREEKAAYHDEDRGHGFGGDGSGERVVGKI